jgi:hypothetical protein
MLKLNLTVHASRKTKRLLENTANQKEQMKNINQDIKGNFTCCCLCIPKSIKQTGFLTIINSVDKQNKITDSCRFSKARIDSPYVNGAPPMSKS